MASRAFDQGEAEEAAKSGNASTDDGSIAASRPPSFGKLVQLDPSNTLEISRFLSYVFNLGSLARGTPGAGPDRISLANLSENIGLRLGQCEAPADDTEGGAGDSDAPSSTSTPVTSSTALADDASANPGAGMSVIPDDRAAAVELGAGIHDVPPGVQIPMDDEHGGGGDVTWAAAERGRVGPAVVALDTVSHSGTLFLNEARTVAESHSNFSSLRANTGVFRGAWMYEVTLMTDGVQQLGWCTIDCPFTHEEGVGDAPDSYAYDGGRVKRWNCSPHDYGEAWRVGDVIGVCLDLDDGTITFYRNGRSLGVAFSGVRAGIEGMAYFPAVSLSYSERIEFNFGAVPFRYPNPRYAPLQDPPSGVDLARATYLLDSLYRLAPYTVSGDAASPLKPAPGSGGVPRVPFGPTERVILGARVMQHLLPYLSEAYFVDALWVEWLAVLVRRKGREVMDATMDLIHAACSDDELNTLFNLTFSAVASRARTAFPSDPAALSGGSGSGSGSGGAAHWVGLFRALLGHRPTRDLLLDAPFFFRDMEAVMCFKDLNAGDLVNAMPVVSWKGARGGDPTADERAFRLAAAALEAGAERAAAARAGLLADLLGDDKPYNAADPRRTPREAVFLWVNFIVGKNRTARRNVPEPGLSAPMVLESVYFALAAALGPAMAAVEAGRAEWDCTLFLRATAEVMDLDRVGGTIAHVAREHVLDDGDLTDTGGVGRDGISLRAFAADGGDDGPRSGLHTFGRHTAEFIDAMLHCYYLGVSSAYKASTKQAQRLEQAALDLVDLDTRAELATSASLLATLADRRRDDHAKVVTMSREAAWSRIRLATRAKQEINFAVQRMLNRVFVDLSALGDEDDPASGHPIFHYVPEHYLETMADLFHSLRRSSPLDLFAKSDDALFALDEDGGFSASVDLTAEENAAALNDFVTFLVLRFNDGRVINPDLRDVLLQGVSVMLQFEAFVRVFEANPTARAQLIPRLLAAFDKRAWVTVTSMLLRLWRGRGFGQQMLAASGETASPLFQARFRSETIENPGAFSTFLNEAFNHLNWCATELTVACNILAEMNHWTGIVPPAAQEVSQARRKVAIMFELTTNMMELMEAITLERADAFVGETGEVNGKRLAELIVYLINHTTSGPDATTFLEIVALGLRSLEKVRPKDILAPALGVLSNLFHTRGSVADGEIGPSMLFAAEPAFHNEVFLELENLAHQWFDPAEPNELAELRMAGVVAALEDVQRAVAEREAAGDDEIAADELCPICYVARIDTTFEPCGHRSCHQCIARSLLNSDLCFFCKAPITGRSRDGRAGDDGDAEPADGSNGSAEA